MAIDQQIFKLLFGSGDFYVLDLKLGPNSSKLIFWSQPIETLYKNHKEALCFDIFLVYKQGKNGILSDNRRKL